MLGTDGCFIPVHLYKQSTKIKTERIPAAAIQQEVYYESLGGMESILDSFHSHVR